MQPKMFGPNGLLKKYAANCLEKSANINKSTSAHPQEYRCDNLKSLNIKVP